MFWVLNQNLCKEEGYKILLEHLQRTNITHIKVKPIPFTHKLLPLDFDARNSTINIDEVPEPYIDTDQNIWVMGSYTLCTIAISRGWKPGCWLDNLSYDVWSSKWLPADLLNPYAIMTKFKDAVFDMDFAFVRPVADSKAFPGKVFDKEEFTAWQKKVIMMSDKDPVNGMTEILLAKPVNIYTETRFFVVDGQIITGSLYKRGTSVFYSDLIDEGAIDFCNAKIKEWVPNKAFVIDVAATESGYKIIELNCFNAAGFYASNVQKIVDAIENLKI